MFQKIKAELKEKKFKEIERQQEALHEMKLTEEKQRKDMQDLLDHMNRNGLSFPNNFPGYPGSNPFDPNNWKVGGIPVPPSWLKNPPLTTEEDKELKELTKERTIQTKQVKLNHFKKLDRFLRQSVINNILWQVELRKINKIEVSPCEREAELINKHRNSMFPNKYSSTTGVNISDLSDRLNFNSQLLPDGFELEDLMQAHAEACLEEELSDVSTNK